MVYLGAILRGYHFERGISALEKGYIAARDSLDNEIKRVDAEAEAYEKSLSEGGEWIGETDEDGRTLWDQSQVYEQEISEIYLASSEVRKAFIIALYHFWEDSVARWMKRDGKQILHSDMEKFCISEGYGPLTDLDAVRHLTNHLKHGRNSGTDWLAALNKKYPSFLPTRQSPFSGFYRDAVGEDTLYKVIAAISASGPAGKRPSAT